MDPPWSADAAGKERSRCRNPAAVSAPAELDSGPRPRPPGPPRPACRLSAATRGARHAAALKGWFAVRLVLPPLHLVLLFVYSFTAKHPLRDARRASGAVGGAAMRRPPCPLWPRHGGLGVLRGRAVRAAPLLRRGRPAGDLRPAAGGRRRRRRRGAAGRRRPRLPHLRGAVPRVRPPRRPPHPAALHLPAGRKGPGGEGLPPSPSGGGALPGLPGDGASRAPCVRGRRGRPWPLTAAGGRARPALTAIRPPSRPQAQRGAREPAPASRGWESQAQVAAQGGRGALRSVCVGLPGCPCGEGWTSPMSGMESAPLLRDWRRGAWNWRLVGV